MGLAAATASAEAIPELADVPVGVVLAILLAPLGLALLAWGSAISREALGDAIAAGQRLWNPDAAPSARSAHHAADARSMGSSTSTP